MIEGYTFSYFQRNAIVLHNIDCVKDELIQKEKESVCYSNVFNFKVTL